MRFISNFISRTSGRPWVGHLTAGSTDAIRFVLVASGYFLAARLSLSFAVLSDVLSPFWPPSAIALCACLAWGLRMAPAIWLATALEVTYSDLPFSFFAINGIGASLEACAAAYLIRRLYSRPLEFVQSGPVFQFIGVALLCGVIGASIGVAGLALTQQLDGATLPLAWLTWWLGDAAGMIVGAPLILAWDVRAGVRWNAARITEAIVFAILLPTITQGAFGGLFGNWPVAYLSIPFVLWAAFRFNLAAVTWTIATICVVAVWNTAHDQGPFASSDLNTSLMLLMIYVSVISTAGLALASLLHQRSEAERKLRAERDSLERRVHSRTGALVEDIEARKRVEQQLADAQQLAQIGSWNWDFDSGTITWSDQLYRIYGVQKENFDVTIENCRPLIHPGDLKRVEREVTECRQSDKPFRIEHRIVLPSGLTRTVAARGQMVRDCNGRTTSMFGTLQDITEAKIAETSLREAEERYRLVVELSPDAILVQQAGIVVFANHAAVALLRADNSEQIVGRPLLDFLPEDYHSLARPQGGESLPAVEAKLVRLDGSSVDVEISSSTFVHHGRFASLFIVRDTTERKNTIEQMAYLAHFDSLTGLPNRMLFHQRLEHALTIAERPGRSLEVLFLDLDRFKNINDTLGHATGDRLLTETAQRLQGILRESDTVARLGGDEFVVLVENVDEPHRGGIIAEKILAALRPPFRLDAEPLSVTTSIGISSFPSDGTNAETLLKNADIAMYRAKEMGRNNYRYYSPEMNRHTAERLSLEYALSHAIEQNQLSLHYQPKVDVVSNRITGMEALLRWQHPTLGALAPQRFIPLAEENGLINSIGYWALRTACQQNKYWQQTSPVRLCVAVNLSARQLSDEKLIDNIAAILGDTELDARYLELEITESAVMANPDRTIMVLGTLREMGVSVAIDDFGIGYSSLAYLKRFPIRTVKIDRSFVQGIPTSRGDSAITKAIISLAHSLECSVVAEGAETQQQYDFLREHDCDSVQGFYFGEPMPAEHFGDLIKVQSNSYLH